MSKSIKCFLVKFSNIVLILDCLDQYFSMPSALLALDVFCQITPDSNECVVIRLHQSLMMT